MSLYANRVFPTITTNYVLSDFEAHYYQKFYVDPATYGELLTITLPTLAANQGVILDITTTSMGICKIDGEGAETLDTFADRSLYSTGDNIRIVGTASNWKILKLKSTIPSGWIIRDLFDSGFRFPFTMEIPYDNLTGTFKVGEIVTGTGGVTGIIITDTGSNLLRLYNISSIGYFSDNQDLTGSKSGATCKVNINPDFNTKDYAAGDSSTYHGFGVNIDKLKLRFFYNESASWTNMVEVNIFAYYDSDVVPTSKGLFMHQVDTNNINLKSCADYIIVPIYTSNTAESPTAPPGGHFYNGNLVYEIN